MKSRMRESCSYGSVRGWAGDCPVYSTEKNIWRKPKKTRLKRFSVRTNICLDKRLMRKIGAHTKLKNQREIVDFALKTAVDVLEQRDAIRSQAREMFGFTKNAPIYPKGYYESVRGKAE